MGKAATPRRLANRRPSRTTLTALGADRLAELLLAAAKADTALMRRLSLEVTAESGDLAGEVDRQIGRIAKASSWLDARKNAALMREIGGLAAVITTRLGSKDPAAGVERLLALLELGPGLLVRRSAGGEMLMELLGGLAGPIAELLAGVPDPVAQSGLAISAYRIDLADDDGFAPKLMVQVAAAIGPVARQSLKAQVRVDLEAQRKAAGDRRGSSSHLLFKLADTLGAIADAEGDADAFAAAQALKGRARDDLAIARRLLQAGRADEALAVVSAATPSASASGGSRPAEALADLKVQVLDALQRHEEAQALRWAMFEASLSVEALRAHLRRLPDFEDLESEARALAYVETHPDALAALGFLLSWPDLRAAARLVRARLSELDGEVYQRLTPAAEALALKEPLAATLLYRRMIDDALKFGRSGRYRYAAGHMQDCASLAPTITDWGEHPDHATYLERLVQLYRYKESFWAKLAGA